MGAKHSKSVKSMKDDTDFGGPQRRNTSPDLHISKSLKRELNKKPNKSRRSSFSRTSQISALEDGINILSPLGKKCRLNYNNIETAMTEDKQLSHGQNRGTITISSYHSINENKNHGFLTPQTKKKVPRQQSNPFLSPRAKDARRPSLISSNSVVNAKLFSPSTNQSKMSCSTASPSKFNNGALFNFKSVQSSLRNSQDDLKEMNIRDRVVSTTAGTNGVSNTLGNTLNVAHAHERVSQTSSTKKKSLDIKEIVIASRFRLIKKLGKGSFGVAYESLDLLTNDRIAIKLERKRQNQTSAVNVREIAILQRLAGCPRVPTLIWHGMYKQYGVMAMELQGMNLTDLYELCGREFTLKTAIYILIECILCVQQIHSKGITHRDIKPQNFILSRNQFQNRIHVIDFGLSSWFRTAMDEHIPFSKCSPVGTARYASINNHRGVHQTRRDDLESIGYMVIFFLKGELPWQGIREPRRVKKWKKIQQKKQSVSNASLTQGLPMEFCYYLDSVKKLAYDEAPNYDKLIKVFKKLYVARGYYQEDMVSRSRSTIGSENADSLPESCTLSLSTSDKRLADQLEYDAKDEYKFDIAEVVVPDWQELTV